MIKNGKTSKPKAKSCHLISAYQNVSILIIISISNPISGSIALKKVSKGIYNLVVGGKQTSAQHDFRAICPISGPRINFIALGCLGLKTQEHNIQIALGSQSNFWYLQFFTTFMQNAFLNYNYISKLYSKVVEHRLKSRFLVLRDMFKLSQVDK